MPVTLEVGGLEQRVDGVLLGRLDEAAGVDQHRVGGRRVVDQPEPVRRQPAGELLGVHLVARAAERHEGDGQRLAHPVESPTCWWSTRISEPHRVRGLPVDVRRDRRRSRLDRRLRIDDRVDVLGGLAGLAHGTVVLAVHGHLERAVGGLDPDRRRRPAGSGSGRRRATPVKTTLPAPSRTTTCAPPPAAVSTTGTRAAVLGRRWSARPSRRQARRGRRAPDRVVHHQPGHRPGQHHGHHGRDDHRPVRAAAGAADRAVPAGGQLGLEDPARVDRRVGVVSS